MVGRNSVAAVLALALGVGGCATGQYIEVSSGSSTTRVPVVPGETARARLTGSSGPVQSVRYAVDASRRIYLLRGDLGAGIDPADGQVQLLRFPRTSGFEADDPRETEIHLGIDRDWGTLLAYDVGECSLFIPWLALQAEVNRRLSAGLLASGNFGTSVSVNVPGSGFSNLGTIHRPSGDDLRYNGTLRTNSAGGCAPLVLSFEARYRLAADARSGQDDRLCPGRVVFDPPVKDFSLAPLESRAEVHDFCIAEGEIEDQIVAGFRTNVPAELAVLIEKLTEFSATDLGIHGVRCECDAACPNTLRGPRSTCRDGRCSSRIELDRVLLLPEGVALVYAGTPDDPQRPLMERIAATIVERLGGPLTELVGIAFSCDPDRAPGVPPSATSPEAANLRRVCR